MNAEHDRRARGFLFRPTTEVACLVFLPRDRSPIGTLLFLHGRGECGTTGLLPLVTGLPRWIMLQPERWPFAVVIPQKPDPNQPWHRYQDAVLGHLDSAITQHGLDRDRVAITGLSQGGNGALRIGSAVPSRFRAVAAVCGFARFFDTEPVSEEQAIVDRIAEGLAGVPVRLYHGEADTVIPADESRRVHRALRERGSNALLELYPDVDHNAWDRAYGESDLAEWLARLLAG